MGGCRRVMFGMVLVVGPGGRPGSRAQGCLSKRGYLVRVPDDGPLDCLLKEPRAAVLRERDPVDALRGEKADHPEGKGASALELHQARGLIQKQTSLAAALKRHLLPAAAHTPVEGDAKVLVGHVVVCLAIADDEHRGPEVLIHGCCERDLALYLACWDLAAA